MRPRPALAVVLVAMLTLAGCGDTYQWNQRLTVEVDTPEGVVSGSGMSALSWTKPWMHVGDRYLAGGTEFIKGEAAVVVLPNGRYLFALLRSERSVDYSKYVALRSFHQAGLLPEDRDEAFPILASLRTAIDLPPDWYPLLVTFTDIDDPTTVKRVDPGDLAATFGPGYALRAITLEITDAPVTEGQVEQVLGWINSPSVLKNPTWRSLPSLSQTAIMGLRKPGGVKE